MNNLPQHLGQNTVAEYVTREMLAERRKTIRERESQVAADLEAKHKAEEANRLAEEEQKTFQKIRAKRPPAHLALDAAASAAKKRKCQASLDRARRIFGNGPDKFRAVVFAVCKYYGLVPLQILSHTHLIHIAKGRQMVMYLCVVDLKYSTTLIGRFLGRDHSTVTHARQKVDALLQAADPAISEAIVSIRNMIKGGSYAG